MRTSSVVGGIRLVFLGVVAVGAAACDVTLGPPGYSVMEEKTFAVSGPAEVSIKTWDGSIEVRGWDKNEVRIEVEKRGPDQAAVDRIQVKASQSGNAVTVEIAKPSGLSAGGMRSSPSASLVVSVPVKTTLVARSGDGSIKIRRITGKIDLDTDDGSLRLDEISGELVARTGDGSIRCSDIDGRVTLKTGDGSVELIGKPTALSILTNDGSIELVARDGSRADEAWEITTGDGSIQLTLPRDFAANLDAHTGDGRIRVDNLDGKSVDSAKDEDSHRSTVRGKIGAGGKLLKLHTGDGRITVSGG